MLQSSGPACRPVTPSRDNELFCALTGPLSLGVDRTGTSERRVAAPPPGVSDVWELFPAKNGQSVLVSTAAGSEDWTVDFAGVLPVISKRGTTTTTSFTGVFSAAVFCKLLSAGVFCLNLPPFTFVLDIPSISLLTFS